MSKKVVLLTLQTFSATGGIQKMTRTLAHSLFRICKVNTWDLQVLSLYDADKDLQVQYLPPEKFKGFNRDRISFVSNTIANIRKNDTVILSHINFAIIGLLIKLVSPKCKVLLIAHGIEVWRPLNLKKRLLLKYCDKILCVSQYTKDQLIIRHKIDGHKCFILNNAIDPFIKQPAVFVKPQELLNRYSLSAEDLVIFTLTRLASTEKFKGYDNVIAAVGRIKHRFPGIKYMLSGKYDQQEEIRVNQLINDHDVSKNVILTGFIAENELVDHFLLADVFVLPSKKEGFGIVFIEALACGLPVICGNSDGSLDAIRHGELGTAIDPDDADELAQQITQQLLYPLTFERRKTLQEKCLQYFSEDTYIDQLQVLLAD